MKLLRTFPLLSFIMVMLSIVGVCLAQESVALLLTAGTLAVISWYITEGPRGMVIPRWVSNILIIAVSLYAFGDVMQHPDTPLAVLARFTVFLTLIRLYERKGPREHAQLMTLSMLLILTGCLSSADLLFGVVLLVYATVGLHVLLLYQMYASYEKARAERRQAMPVGEHVVGPLKPIIGRHATGNFRLLTGSIGFMGLVLSGVVFLAFPRHFGPNLLAAYQPPGGSRQTGFLEEVSLLQGGRITSNRARMMTVRVRDAQGRVTRGTPPILLRGAVLERYNERRARWEPESDDESMSLRTVGGQPKSLAADGIEPGRSFTLDVNVFGPFRHVFVPYAPVSITTEHDRTFEFTPNRLTLAAAMGSGRLPSYSITYQPAPTAQTLDALSHDEPATRLRRRERYRNPVVRDLAQNLLAAAGERIEAPEDAQDRFEWSRRVATILLRFLQDGSFTYTLDLSDVVLPAPDQGGDPIVQFLTETRRGHCEFYASALVAMCQSLNVQARMVTGFVAFEYNESEQYYNVLASNAHAWAEVRTGDKRWETFDPTPPSTLAEFHDTESTFADQLRWVYQRFENDWANNVIEYDADRQANLARSMESGWTQRFTDWFDSLRNWLSRVNESFYLGPAGYIWMGIVAAAVLIAMIAVVRYVRRVLAGRRLMRLRRMFGLDSYRILRQLGFYLDMLLVLERHGMGKPEWQPPLQFARSIAGEHTEAATIVLRLSELFYEGRFGQRSLSANEIEQAQSQVVELTQMLRKKR